MDDPNKNSFIDNLNNWLSNQSRDNFEKIVDALLLANTGDNVNKVLCINVYKVISLLENGDILAGYTLQKFYEIYCIEYTPHQVNKLLDNISIQYNPTFIKIPTRRES